MAAFRNSQSPTAWLLALVLGLSLFQQAAVAFVRTAGSSDLKMPLGQTKTGLTPGTTQGIQQAPERGVDGLSKDLLLLPLQLNTDDGDGSGNGSWLRENLTEVNRGRAPSSGTMEKNISGLGGKEKRDLRESVTDSPPLLAGPQILMQRIIRNDNHDDQDIMMMNRNDPSVSQATTTLPVPSTAPAHSKATMITNNTKSNVFLTTRVGPAIDKEMTPIRTLEETHAVDGSYDMGTTISAKTIDKEAPEEKQFIHTTSFNAETEDSGSTSSSGLKSIADQLPDMTSVFREPPEPLHVEKMQEQEAIGVLPMDKTTIQKGNRTSGGAAAEAQTPIGSLSSVNRSEELDGPKSRDDDKSRWFGGIFGPITEKGLSEPSGPCALGLGPCVFPTSPNGTLLQWEDLRRTLAFAWELHVFGSAIFFMLVVIGAFWGVIGGSGICQPFCEPLTLANVLLLLSGLLRFVQFIVDPYGTRHILPRPILAALYNLPLALLLWAQVTLALLALKGTRLNLLTPALQRPHVTGGLATLHCASLLGADLLSHTLSPALPLMLQTLSICWGLPLCLGILFRALPPLRSAARTPIPRWGAYKRVEERARRVLIVCALLGVLCCTLQIHGLLWMYGLLGDWRRFGWGWWLGQFWARLLELSWSFSMLLLGSRAFWRPSRGGPKRGDRDQGQGAGGRSENGALASSWDRVLKCLPWRRQENAWADLLPNNWAGYQQSRTDIKNSVVENYEANASVGVKDSHANSTSNRAYSTSNYDSQSAPRWSHGLEWQERDCVLSLIEFDLCPPSPIELRRSIDNALHFGHLLGSMGSLFTPPPPSWTQSEVSTAAPGGDFATQTTPTHIAYRWALDAESCPISPQCFRLAQEPEVAVLDPETFLPPDITSEIRLWERNSAIPAVKEEGDWISITSGDDITNL
uniref:Si:ch211-14i3.2 n=1 Tax=Astyanax mexicanus TaxID=7994 RepID=A0A3B1JZ72_ASTMX